MNTYVVWFENEWFGCLESELSPLAQKNLQARGIHLQKTRADSIMAAISITKQFLLQLKQDCANLLAA